MIQGYPALQSVDSEVDPVLEFREFGVCCSEEPDVEALALSRLLSRLLDDFDFGVGDLGTALD